MQVLDVTSISADILNQGSELVLEEEKLDLCIHLRPHNKIFQKGAWLENGSQFSFNLSHKGLQAMGTDWYYWGYLKTASQCKMCIYLC